MRSAQFVLQAKRFYSSFTAAGQAPWSLPALALTANTAPFFCSFYGSSSDDGRHGRKTELEELLGGSRQPPAPEQIRERDAQRLMDDPLSLLMASRGMPLGLTLKLKPNGADRPSVDRDQLQRAEQRVASQLSDLAKSISSEAQAAEQLQQLVSEADSDSWGTTKKSAAEIAKHIADSNAGAGAGGQGDGEDDGDRDIDEELQAALETHQQASIEAYGRDIKEMDEMFEIIAKVPWLRSDDVDDLQLGGVVTMGLLGTLEEVGWGIRQGVHRIWQGERDVDAVMGGAQGKEQAALVSILYHTHQLELEFGPAPNKPSAHAGAGGSEGSS